VYQIDLAAYREGLREEEVDAVRPAAVRIKISMLGI